MSATNRKKASKEHDIYPTPMPLVHAAFDMLITHHPHLLQAKRVLEPGANVGPFCRVARLYCRQAEDIAGVELFPPQASKRFDYRLIQTNFLRWKCKTRFNLLPTNPPFRWAEDFIRKGLEVLTPDGAMLYLMRVGILEAKCRRELWSEVVNLEEMWVINPRPSFAKSGSDATTYAFFLMDGRLDRIAEPARMRVLEW